MPKISSTTELLMLSIFGLAITVYESSIQNINESVKEVWAMQFPANTTIGMESLLKTVMTAVTLARGLTVHIYIAAYLLMFYPFLFERGVTLLLVWMFICAVRSVIVNFVALLTGCILCSMYSEMKPVCFEFAATKAIEISCSVFMWLSVNDQHIRLRNRRRDILTNRMIPKTTQITDSDLSLVSSDITLASFMNLEDDAAASSESEDSMLVKAAVDWLMRTAFGIKYENKRMEMDDVRAQRFLNMSPEELMELQDRIKEKLIINKEESQLVKREFSTIDKAGSLQLESQNGSSSGLWHVDEKIPNALLEPPFADIRSIHTSELKEKRSSRMKSSVMRRLSTQSTGSQTTDPSRKLREKLSQEGTSKDDIVINKKPPGRSTTSEETKNIVIDAQLAEELAVHKDDLMRKIQSINRAVRRKSAKTQKHAPPESIHGSSGSNIDDIEVQENLPGENLLRAASSERVHHRSDKKVRMKKKPGFE